jgi:hypothetical protein
MATNFEKAFASARKGGKKEFSFGGKKYNTKLKGEGGKAKKDKLPKKGPVPEKRPMSKPATGKATSSKPTEAKAKVAVRAKAATPAKKSASAMKQAVRIQTGPQTKSYADRYKKPPVRMGSGGGY